MKKFLIVTIMLLMYTISKAQKIKPIEEEKEIDGKNKILAISEVNNILTAAIDDFNSLKTSVETNDEFHFGDNGYKSKYCLHNASKCEINISKYLPQFATRFGPMIMTQNEAFKLYDSLFNFFSTTPLVWGISETTFATDNESGKAATFNKQINADTGDKFNGVSISIKTNYIDDNKFQVLMYIGK